MKVDGLNKHQQIKDHDVNASTPGTFFLSLFGFLIIVAGIIAAVNLPNGTGLPILIPAIIGGLFLFAFAAMVHELRFIRSLLSEILINTPSKPKEETKES
jgi:hypothetical protein